MNYKLWMTNKFNLKKNLRKESLFRVKNYLSKSNWKTNKFLYNNYSLFTYFLI